MTVKLSHKKVVREQIFKMKISPEIRHTHKYVKSKIKIHRQRTFPFKEKKKTAYIASVIICNTPFLVLLSAFCILLI